MMINVSAVRWWGWLGVGVIVGALLGGARVYWQGQAGDPNALPLTQSEFEKQVTADQRTLSGITVFPEHDGVHFVTASGAKGKSIVYAAAEPYRPELPVELKGKSMTFVQYLKSVHMGYSYVWSEDWRRVMGVWVGLGVVSIGIVWPMVLALLIRWGFAPPRPVREPKYDLSRFKPEEKRETPAKTEISTADLEKLRELEAELARNLASGGDVAGAARRGEAAAPVNDPAASAPAGLRPNPRFSSAPAEPLAATDAPREDKTYRGIFYPTEVHTPKKPGA